MCKKLKTILYWLSLVRPIADILIGAWKGVIATVQDTREAERLAQEREQLKIDHSMPFLSDYEEKENINDR